jgi:hypothetical protein
MAGLLVSTASDAGIDWTSRAILWSAPMTAAPPISCPYPFIQTPMFMKKLPTIRFLHAQTFARACRAEFLPRSCH